MHERVLSDAQVDALLAGHCPLNKWVDAVRLARAVEQNVLAKVEKVEKVPGDERSLVDAVRSLLGIDSGRRFSAWFAELCRIANEGGEMLVPGGTPAVVRVLSRNEKYVTEAEAQKRELQAKREAYALGWLDCPIEPQHATSERLMRGNRDLRYPLPRTMQPRSVTLSDGTLVSASPIEGGPRFYVTWRKPGCGGRTGSLNNPLQLAETPNDARLLADLVERPFEEVPA